MTNNRRDFIKTVGLASAALTLPFVGKTNLLEGFGAGKKLDSFGLQLWTVKEDMEANAKATLAKLAKYGYKQIESFEGKQGMYWGMKNTEFKKYMDDLGMKIVSSHCNYKDDFERKAAEAAEIGIKYLVCSYVGPQKSIEDFKKISDEFNTSGAICKKNAIRFAYHNHDYSFKQLDGLVPQSVMMEGTDASLVDFEMDIYWVVTANEDPIKWLKKYPQRFRLCHVKDQGKTATGFDSCEIGKGTINFSAILKEGKQQGLKYFIVEQEEFTGSTPLKSAALNAAYMKKFTI